jgi:hypothetical protein
MPRVSVAEAQLLLAILENPAALTGDPELQGKAEKVKTKLSSRTRQSLQAVALPAEKRNQEHIVGGSNSTAACPPKSNQQLHQARNVR